VKEANRLGIPVIAVVDTNCDPDLIDIVIPGNDDAIRSGALLTRIIADACAEGHQIRASRTEDDVVAEQVAALAAAAASGQPDTGAEAEPLAEWEIALQREEAARRAAQAGAGAESAEPAGQAEEEEPAPVEQATAPIEEAAAQPADEEHPEG
jgi:small subunit ribosomal protein S2